MAKAAALGLLLAVTCTGAVRTESEELSVLADDDDDKCDAACPGSVAARHGNILGGLKECACKEGLIIADEGGSGSFNTLHGSSDFEFEKAGHFRGYKCMSRNEKATRRAKEDIKAAVAWNKDSSTSWKFLGVNLHAQALGSSGSALSGGEGVLYSTDNYFGGFDCASRSPKLAELDAACEDGLAAFPQGYQTEAVACLDAVRGLEMAKDFVDGAAFGQAVASLSETAKILHETGSRDKAAGAAKQTWAAMLTLTKEIDSKVTLPPW